MDERRDFALPGGRSIDPSEVKLRWETGAGPGGQHRNRTRTRVRLEWRPGASRSLSEEERQRVASRLARRLTRDGRLVLVAGRHRSAARNRAEAIERLRALVAAALEPPARRRATRRPAWADRRRIEQARRRARIKKWRRPPGPED